MEKLLNSIKNFIIRMELEVSKKAKNLKDEEHYKFEMKNIFVAIYRKVGNFEKDFYDVQLQALKVV